MNGMAGLKWLIVLIAMLVLSACATVPEYEMPTVSVTSLRLLPSGSVTPHFEIGLHIINPNRVTLHPRGIAYSVFIEDHKILTGASNDLPEIEAYGEGEVTLHAVTNLMGSISLISDLVNRPRDDYAYRIEAKMDIGGSRPELRIADEGHINLQR